jgi:WD40 repeat protein
MRDRSLIIETEELLVGDELGHIWIYSIEWPSVTDRDIFAWDGCLTLLCRITAHTQQICGLAWTLDGESFATGGNDNICHLFDTHRVLAESVVSGAEAHSATDVSFVPHRRANLSSSSFNLSSLYVRHCFTVAAAVKAIAFCPWQRGLIAIGGGSNDRRIHFFHTLSGAKLATLDCHAQVTSLV